MLSESEVRQELKRRGITLARNTLFKYRRLRLMPRGEQVEGRGNVTYFPDDTPDRIAYVHWQNKVLGIELEKIDRTLYDLPHSKRPVTPQLMFSVLASIFAHQQVPLKGELTQEQLDRIKPSIQGAFQSLGLLP